MQLVLELLGTEPLCLLGQTLTPASPTAEVPLRILENMRIYSKSTNRLSFGAIDYYLDTGVLKMTIPPSREITTSAQLRALEIRGVITFDKQDGTPYGYRGGIEFSDKFTVTEDVPSNTVEIDVNTGGIIEYGPPVSTAQANVEGTETKVSRADHVHRTGLKVQEEGTDKGTRPTIDFKGAVSVVDNAGDDKVEVTIEGGGRRMATFTFADWPGYIDVEAPVPADSTIQEVVVEVTGAFDAGRVQVGDNAVHDRLMNEYDSDLTQAGNTYKTTSTYTYGSSAQLRVYFAGGTPTTGNGFVIIYFASG